jgi:hypothetical protein
LLFHFQSSLLMTHCGSLCYVGVIFWEMCMFIDVFVSGNMSPLTVMIHDLGCSISYVSKGLGLLQTNLVWLLWVHSSKLSVYVVSLLTVYIFSPSRHSSLKQLSRQKKLHYSLAWTQCKVHSFFSLFCLLLSSRPEMTYWTAPTLFRLIKPVSLLEFRLRSSLDPMSNTNTSLDS